MKKLILFPFLLITCSSFSQELVDCLTKFGMKAKPEVNACLLAKAEDTGGISRGYLECVCANIKLNESKRNDKKGKSENTKEVTQKEEDDTNTQETYFLLINQYDSMLSRVQNIDSNSKEYEDLIKQMRTTEKALNIPRHQYYDNPGFINENTTNSELNKTYKNINDTKESIDNFTSSLTNTVDNMISARADRIGLEDREKSIKSTKKNQLKTQETYYTHLQIESREKTLLSLIDKFNTETEKKYNNYSTEQKKNLKKDAFKYIGYTSCPNPKCKNGIHKVVTLDKITCNTCKGKKSLHNHGNGGGSWGPESNFMSCTRCLGVGEITELNYNKENCPVCDGDNKIFIYKGEGHLPYKQVRYIYNNETFHYENAMNYFKDNPEKKFYSYYKAEDKNQSNLFFVDKDFENYTPSFVEIYKSKNESIGAIVSTKYGYDGKINEQLSLKDGIRTIRNYDNGKVNRVRHFDEEGFPIGEHTHDWGNYKTIEIYDKNFLLKFNESTYIKKNNSELSTLHQRPILIKKIHLNGNVLEITDNQKGSIKLYHENGSKKHFYKKEKNSTRFGEHKVFHDNGQIAEIGTYGGNHYDSMIGEFKTFYKSGKLKSEGQISNSIGNNKKGKWKSYYENGQLKSEEKYSGQQYGKKKYEQGTWKYYDENGKLTKTIKQ